MAKAVIENHVQNIRVPSPLGERTLANSAVKWKRIDKPLSINLSSLKRNAKHLIAS